VARRGKDLRKTILLPASVGIALLLACALVLLAALTSAPAASAASFEHGASFAVRCTFDPDHPHRLKDDPIVFPGNPGASHRHDFFGSTTTDAFSTYNSMISSPTTCKRPEDTAGYWFPTVSWNGAVKYAYRVVFYYRAGGKDYRTVQPYAKDLRIIADPDDNGAGVRWYCGGGGRNDEKSGSVDPPTRCSSGVLGLRIVFPDCVAKNSSGAQRLDSDNHRSHMVRSKAQSNGSRVCPSTHIPVPTLTINANFQIGTSSGKVSLSSDQPGDTPGSSIHTDFWNTWDQGAPWSETGGNDGRHFGGLKALVENCINAVPPTESRPEPCRAPTATA
jgi:Domain of unknown function (DUF1996)